MKHTRRLLVADDDFTSRQMLHAMLTKWGFDVVSVCDGNEAWRVLNEPEHPKLAILDWIMPGMDGLEVVRKLRAKNANEPHYVIILTSRDQKKDIAEALNAGADDHITKPYDVDELQARIGVGLRVIGLQAALADRIQELDEANATIAQLACTDELTKLANRRSFNDRLTSDISGSRRHGYPLCLIMADMDRFKHINDSFGHGTGDRVLEAFADLMVRTVRREDFAARWGGEEFAILLPHTDAQGGARLAERLRKRFAETRFLGVDLTLSASFGVAELQEGESEDSLLRRADTAMMRAKLEGRNRVVIASHEGGRCSLLTSCRGNEVTTAELACELGGVDSSVILIVDDDPVTVQMLKAILRNAGFETAQAVNGAQAITQSQQVRPDLILLDVNLPDTDGFTVCNHIRSNPSTADTSIVFISANDDLSVKATAFEAGGVDYITKPLAGVEVTARVRTHLRLKHAYDTLAQLQAKRVERLASTQQMILPTSELMPNARFAVTCKQVHGAGGDFYDVIPVGDSLVDYVVADASGHALETSLWTTAMKTMLHEHAKPIFEPTEILHAINRSLCRVLPSGLFFTVLYARLNRQDGRLTIVNGAHPPAILLRTGAESQVIEQTGDVIGAFSDVVFDTTHLLLRPGDRFFLYTDGLVGEGASPDAGTAGLARLCLEHRNLPLKDQVEIVTAGMLARVVNNDDVVLMGVEV